MESERKQELLEHLVEGLCAERGVMRPDADGVDELWAQFRALVNTRPPAPPSAEWLAMQDELLQGIIAEAGVHSPDDAAVCTADARLRLWRGDITAFAADAIVNAANSQMLGCWVPGHHCIDNAIHTFAGVQLRGECARIMQEQGHEEPTGCAKITDAYNLPSRFVLHTVGPIAGGRPTDEHCRQLESCYRSCLELAQSHGLHSVTFCCISTGVFGFPQAEAAHLAVGAVRSWLDVHDPSSDMVVVFNVFGERDEALYRKELQMK